MAKKTAPTADPSAVGGGGPDATVETEPVVPPAPSPEDAIEALDPAPVTEPVVVTQVVPTNDVPADAVVADEVLVVAGEGEKLFFPFVTLQAGYGADFQPIYYAAETIVALPAAEVDRLVALGVGRDPDAPVEAEA